MWCDEVRSCLGLTCSRGYIAQGLDVIRNEVFAAGSLRRSGLQ